MVLTMRRRPTWDGGFIRGVLANSGLFRGTPAQAIATIAGQCWSLEVGRLQPIMLKGSRLPGIYAVAYGKVKLALRQPNGAQRVIALVQAGETFGEAEAFLGRPAGFEASAVTVCKLVVIPSEATFGLIDRDARAARQVLASVARRNVELLAELESSSLRHGGQRLATYLAGLAEPVNGAARGVCKVRLPATKTLIASRLDMKKETLSRLLRAFATQGLIEVKGGDITLLDPAGLAEVA
jgi:CRP-like cAMP-binding protein